MSDIEKLEPPGEVERQVNSLDSFSLNRGTNVGNLKDSGAYY